MAWNEPGNGKDPWGGNTGNQGPPDIDEALKKLRSDRKRTRLNSSHSQQSSMPSSA